MRNQRGGWVALLLALLLVPGMSCGGDDPMDPANWVARQSLFHINDLRDRQGAAKIRSALRRTRGVTYVEVDLPLSQVLVTYETSVTDNNVLIKVIRDAGYVAVWQKEFGNP